jgi:hypothetical protein
MTRGVILIGKERWIEQKQIALPHRQRLSDNGLLGMSVAQKVIKKARHGLSQLCYAASCVSAAL